MLNKLEYGSTKGLFPHTKELLGAVPGLQDDSFDDEMIQTDVSVHTPQFFGSGREEKAPQTPFFFRGNG